MDPLTSNAHESEIIPHDLTLLRKSPDVIVIIALKKEPPDLDVDDSEKSKKLV